MNPFIRYVIGISVIVLSLIGHCQDIKMVKDINPGISSSDMGYNVIYNNLLCFAAKHDLLGFEFCTLDFNDSLTMYDITPGSMTSFAQPQVVFNDILLMSASDGIHGNEIWKFDGNTFPQMIKDINPGSAGSNPHKMIIFQGKVYFNAEDNIHGKELWVYDGVNDPSMVMDIIPGIGGSNPDDFYLFDNKLLFTAYCDFGRELFEVTSQNQVQMVVDLNPGLNSGLSQYYVCFEDFENYVYFNGNDGTNGYELWRYDGVNPPQLVADINPGAAWGSPLGMISFNNKLVFQANDGIHGEEIWQYDGIAAPYLVEDLIPGIAGSQYLNMFAGYRSIYKDILYFPGRDTNDADFELWQYDGNNISLVYEINPSGSSNVYYLKTDSNYLYFSATDGVHGQELWQYDAIDIPHMVYDINPGPESCGPFSFSFFNSGLYFRADDGISGSEVWRYRPVTTSVTRNNKIINKCYFNRNLHSIIIEIADIVKFKPNRIVLHNCLGQNIPFSTSEADKSINIRLKNNEPPGLIIITLEINNQIITGKVFIH